MKKQNVIEAALEKIVGLVGYERNNYIDYDLGVDRDIAAKYPNKPCVFLVRENGTLLFPIKCGICEVYLTAYKRDATARYFSVLPSGEFTEIKFEQAEKLVTQAPDLPADHRSLEQLFEKLLSDGNVTSSGFTTASMTDYSPSNWEKWHQWFVGSGNHIMAKTMRKASNIYFKHDRITADV